MPFESEKQRKYMWAVHPEIAERWAHGKHMKKTKKVVKKGGKKMVKVSRKY